MLWVIAILVGVVVVLLWQIWSVLDKACVAQLEHGQRLDRILASLADLVNLNKRHKERSE